MTHAEAQLASVLIEMPLAALAAWLTGWGRPLRTAIAIGLGTAVTHPFLWTAAMMIGPQLPYWPSVLGLEALVVLLEGLLIAGIAALRPYHALLVALFANAASLLAGMALA